MELFNALSYSDEKLDELSFLAMIDSQYQKTASLIFSNKIKKEFIQNYKNQKYIQKMYKDLQYLGFPVQEEEKLKLVIQWLLCEDMANDMHFSQNDIDAEEQAILTKNLDIFKSMYYSSNFITDKDEGCKFIKTKLQITKDTITFCLQCNTIDIFEFICKEMSIADYLQDIILDIIEDGKLHLIKILYETKQIILDSDETYSYLTILAHFGHLDVIKYIFEGIQFDSSKTPNLVKIAQNTLEPQIHVIKYLIDNGFYSVDSINQKYIVRYGNIDLLEYVVSKENFVFELSNFCKLYRNNDFDMIQVVLNSRCKIHINLYTVEKIINGGDLKLFRFLVENNVLRVDSTLLNRNYPNKKFIQFLRSL